MKTETQKTDNLIQFQTLQLALREEAQAIKLRITAINDALRSMGNFGKEVSAIVKDANDETKAVAKIKKSRAPKAEKLVEVVAESAPAPTPVAETAPTETVTSSDADLLALAAMGGEIAISEAATLAMTPA